PPGRAAWIDGVRGSVAAQRALLPRGVQVVVDGRGGDLPGAAAAGGGHCGAGHGGGPGAAGEPDAAGGAGGGWRRSAGHGAISRDLLPSLLPGL
ncbi:unnamed protein product, partial [Effrenium voratum]